VRLRCAVPTSEKFTVQLSVWSALYGRIVVFSLFLTVETSYADICRSRRFSKEVGHFEAKFSVERLLFAPILIGKWPCYNFAAGSFHTKKVCSRLHSTEVDFYSKQVAQLWERNRASSINDFRWGGVNLRLL